MTSMTDRQDEANGGQPPGAMVVMIYSTFPCLEAAKVAARRLVEKRLAACVNLSPGICAIYRWEGRIHEDGEVAAIIKTQASLAQAAIDDIADHHAYANPALVVIPISGGSALYLDWVRSSTRQPAVIRPVD